MKYEDRQEAYYDMNDCPWQPLCDTLWDITKNRLLMENRRKAEGKLFVFALLKNIKLNTIAMDPVGEQSLYDLGLDDFQLFLIGNDPISR